MTSNSQAYAEKFANISKKTSLLHLSSLQQSFTKDVAFKHRFTLQELRQFIEIALDFNNWNEPSIEEIWPRLDSENKTGRDQKKRLLLQLTNHWHELKYAPNHYPQRVNPSIEKPVIRTEPKKQVALGYCPVASEKTRCCNLLTLDAVENCGFDCSYCSIQSFYHGNQVIFDSSFGEKLSRLELDPDITYHIGTGQSSDSLMWGNKHGVLNDLLSFAESNPNVILELKTKSSNINYLSNREIPPNIICTWSLNTQTIIDNEEHQTASLQHRLEAARSIADTGTLIGFHLHPIIHYSGWRDDYLNVYKSIQKMFTPDETAMISFGTLTFIKPVVKNIRERNFYSKILKMPLIETAGKLSYPLEVKTELFTHAYNSFSRYWHDNVFFYLCMENNALWKSVFGYDYQSNEEFELKMKTNYLRKIQLLNNK
jgi:spore photoproduct lyase